MNKQINNIIFRNFPKGICDVSTDNRTTVYNYFIKLISICSLITFAFGIAFAEDSNNMKIKETDSLSLKAIINQVIENHPLIKQSKEALNSSNAKIDLAKTGYYPKIDAVASYTRLAPISSMQFGPETFDLYPANNYNANLEIKQVIYDFGKTSSNVDFESRNRALTQESIEQVKQKFATITINVFFNMIYLQEAIKIKDIELKNLKEHLDFISKKLSTGSATNYEILSTQVKISNTESQKTDLLSAQKTQFASMNSLMGLSDGSTYNLMPEQFDNKQYFLRDSLLQTAYSQRDELIMLKEKANIAELYYKTQDQSDNPMILLFANGGMKNGYFPNMFRMMFNYAVGVSVEIPIFDAFRKKNNLLIAQSSIASCKFETESTKRNISNEVIENYNNLTAAKKKVEQFTMQVKHAEQAYDLAKTNFNTGAITNMDLLDAQTNVSESNLLLLKAKIDFELSVYKLRSALGVRLY